MRRILAVGTMIMLAAPAAIAQQQDNSVGRAAMQPLRDTRIKEDKIPEILQLAASAPYSMVGMRSCAQIAAEVGRLNDALGADADVPEKKKGEGSAIAAAAASAAVNSLIPGLGLIKVITGADKAERRAQAAVYAGAIRRGFLKGLGQSKGCRPPAAPAAEALRSVQELPVADKDDDKKDDKPSDNR